MTYASRPNTARKTATITAVALLHVGVVYVLINGLAGVFVPHIERPFESFNVPLDPPTKPPKDHVTPKAHHADTVITLTDPIIDVTLPDTHTILPPFKPVGISDPDPIVIEPPKPSPSPSFTPKSAAPLGRPGAWVTANDYPTNDLRAEHAGLTRFRLSIGADGLVQSCTITSSSGWPGLDAATCAKLTQRARFQPASDESGTKVAGVYASSVRWIIPE